ncbi:hypothetical protein NKH72_34290 [Mesorhizobium sp. M0955]|uniref:hypothetical protein n=1 Tax=Mesorhizobium sp. M0955 TaxID=2957033 RepID=UPI003336B13F
MVRWLREQAIEAYITSHPASVAVAREHRRAKTDRPDTELLMRASIQSWTYNRRFKTRPGLTASA